MNDQASPSFNAALQAPSQSLSADVLRKKLRWRAWHRGTQELDLLLGGFADAHLAAMDLETLRAFELFMLAEDPEIQAWLQGDKPFPPDVPQPLLGMLQAYDFVPVRR